MAVTMKNHEIFVPIAGLKIRNLETFNFTRYLRISREGPPLSESHKEAHLSKFDKNEIRRCQFILYINDKKPKDLTDSEIINLFFMAFWISGPIRFKAFLKFPSKNDATRLLDRFQWNAWETEVQYYAESDLINVKSIYEQLVSISRNKYRLNTALYCNYRACVFKGWREAFIMLSATLEALMIYKANHAGIKERLSKVYSALVSSSIRERGKEYRKFRSLYHVRSQLMHGEFQRRIPRTNLKLLAQVSDVTRKVWKQILDDKELRNALDSSDSERKRYFISKFPGYIPT